MTRIRPGALLRAIFELALFSMFGPAQARAELIVQPISGAVSLAPGAQASVQVLLENTSPDTLYLNTLSFDAEEGLLVGDLLADFRDVVPEILLPGESWEGPLLTFTLSPSVLPNASFAVALDLSGGAHVYDDAALAQWIFTVNAPVDVTGAPPPVAASGPLRVAPNPGRGEMLIEFALEQPQRVEAAVFDVRGRRVARLANGWREAGSHRLTWNGAGDSGAPLGAGIYFVRLTTAAGTRHTKVIRMP